MADNKVIKLNSENYFSTKKQKNRLSVALLELLSKRPSANESILLQYK